MVSTTFAPGDAVLLDGRLVLRFDRYDEHALVVSLSTVTGRPIRTFGLLCDEWVKVTERLGLQYEGIFHNPRCEPTDLASVSFDDEVGTEIRYWRFADVPVVDSDPL